MFDNEIWIMGGGRWHPETVPLRNVSCSEDGVNWTQVKCDVIWKACRERSALFFQNKIRVVGGHAEPLISQAGTLAIPEGWLEND